ncbi:MAG: YceD family protein [Eubacterium sp.]
MLIDLYELLQEEDGRRYYHPQLEASEFKTKNVSYKIKEYDLKLLFHNEGKKHISCQCEGYVVLTIPCNRCLEPVDYKIDIDYFKDLDMNKSAEEKVAELDEENYLEGTNFDSEVLIHNEILVNLPMKVLCRNDCKGICNRCGANLNMGSCKCDNAELDPRMSKILDVFNQFKEV